MISTRAWREDYGTRVLLDSFRLAYQREPRLRLVLLGEGPLAPDVHSYIEQYELSTAVHILGQRPEDELPEYFRSADVYLSCAPCDGSSISLLGAMATGLPVIASDRASNREWVKHEENGWLAHAGEPESFARALAAAARLAPNRRRAMASTNREVASRDANWDQNFPQLLDAYTQLYTNARYERPAEYDRGLAQQRNHIGSTR